MDNEKAFDLHPIQLRVVNVLELSLKKKQGYEDVKELPDNAQFSLTHGHSDFNEENRQICINVMSQIEEESDFPFIMDVAIAGIFTVDVDNFPVDKIAHWARHNAPLILYPYLREHVYSLALRAGYNNGGVILPLLTVPSFKIEKKDPPTLSKKS